MPKFLSTLSLRRATGMIPADLLDDVFLSTLSLRRATRGFVTRARLGWYFYPRSPCGERLYGFCAARIPENISIHALLAESDHSHRRLRSLPSHFYPRSPCGERPFAQNYTLRLLYISIHALLAESDLQAANA